ncbi:hypothetical protein [Dankookia sp. P2]
MTPDTPPRSAARGISAGRPETDSEGYFGALGDKIVTGPTLTNVND